MSTILSAIRSVLLVIILVGAGLGATLLVANAIIRAQLPQPAFVLVRDSINMDSHTLTGKVPISSSCDQLSVYAEQVSDHSYILFFNTWREPYIFPCKENTVSQEFRTVVFGPTLDVSFSAMLNGNPLSIAVIPETPLPPPDATTTIGSARQQ